MYFEPNLSKKRKNRRRGPIFNFGKMLETSNEILHQMKVTKGLYEIYDITDTPSLIGFTLKTVAYLPVILWKTKNFEEIKSKRFWYKNRDNQPVEGIMYGPKGNNPLPLIAFDSGYQRDLFSFSIVGKVIASLGYRTFSIRSKNELKGTEADDYMDAMDYLRTSYPEKDSIGKTSAIIGVSGGNIVVYRSCSSKDFVKRHSVKCAISIAPFADLAEQFMYMKKILKQQNIPDNVKGVLEEYNEYVKSLGVKSTTSDPKMFENGSPITYCKDIIVKILNIHGIKDKIVPASGSLKIHKEMKKNGKEIETILTPGEGIHGDLSKWKKELIPTIGLGASLVYAYTFFKKHLKS